MVETWTPSTFEIATGETRETAVMEPVDGETWGAFGIYEDEGICWAVTHLPTGFQLVVTLSQERARQFCREVAPLTDWTTIQPGRVPPEIRDAYLTASWRARGAMFADVPVTTGANDG